MSNATQFSVTFRIRIAENPAWASVDTDVRFPSITVHQGVKVYSSKYGKILKVYVLHPDVGYRKLAANIEKHLGRDTFVVITVDGDMTTLYLNGEFVTARDVNEMIRDIEVGDYVMVKIASGDLRRIAVGDGVAVTVPAEVKKVDGETLSLYFFELKELASLPRERVVLQKAS